MKTTPSERVHILRMVCFCLNPALPSDMRHQLGALLETMRPEERRKLIAVADAFHFLPALYLALMEKDLMFLFSGEEREALEAALSLNRMRNADLAAQAKDLAKTLSEIDMIPVFLKGMGHILGQTYADPGARVTGDLDVLVPLDRLAEAATHLRQRGYTGFLSDAPIDPSAISHHMEPLRRPTDLARVELHKAFFRDPNYLIPAREILDHARAMDRIGWTAYVPAPAHLMVMNVAHCTMRQIDLYGNHFTLKDALDLMMMLHAQSADLASVARHFELAGATRQFGWFLAAIEYLFGLEITQDAVEIGWRNRLRAHVELHAWGYKGIRRPVVCALQFKRRPEYRKHVRMLLMNRSYRNNWWDNRQPSR